VWIRPHNEEHYDLYFSPNNIVIKSRTRWARHVARTEESRCVLRLFERKPERKITLE
jgi:hypothetical protein